MRSDRLWRYLVCVGIGLLLVRLLGPAWRTGFAPTFPDSSSYLDTAAAGLFSWDFWFGDRPPTYPFLIWLVGPSARAVVVAQTLLAVAAWGWLFSTIWTHVRSRAVAAIAISLLLLIALETRWIFWNTALLTESLSATLAVAMVAAWWRWFAEPDAFRTVTATALVVAWMLLRDSNAITFLVVAAPAFVVVLVLERRCTSDRRRLMAVALTAVLVVGAYSITAQMVTNRGETSLHNNVAARWLPDPEMSGWMEARGMPVSEALAARTGKDAWADGEAMLTSPELAEYRDWADGKGRLAAAASFVVKADWYLDRFDTEIPRYIANEHLLAYDTFDVTAKFPERPVRWLDPVDSRPSLYVWGLLATASIAVLWARRRTHAWLGLFLFVPVISDFYLSYVADAVEVGRHLAGPMLRYSVVAVLVVVLAVDELLTARASASEVAAERLADDPIETAIDV